MTAAIAAFRAGNAPHILQVFEVGTATMMASKGAIKPVGEVMSKAGYKFDPKVYVPAVAGYYTAPNGQMMSYPLNSSTTVFHYNKDAFKAAGLDPDKPPKTWPEVALAAAKLKASGHKCPFTTSWLSWTQLESFSTWHNTEFATKNNGFGGHRRGLRSTRRCMCGTSRTSPTWPSRACSSTRAAATRPTRRSTPANAR